MPRFNSMQEYEQYLLGLPIARSTSGEDDLHTVEDDEFVAPDSPDLYSRPTCMCDRCKIMRLKRRKAFHFPRTKCRACGELFYPRLFTVVGTENTCSKCLETPPPFLPGGEA